MFKVGDIVQCIDSGRYAALEDGGLYEVKFVGDDGIGISTSTAMEYFNKRFRLYDRPSATTIMVSDEYELAIASQEAYNSVKG